MNSGEIVMPQQMDFLEPDEGEALPEPRFVKRMVLKSRREAQQRMLEWRTKPNSRNFERFKNAVIQFYQDLRVYIQNRDDVNMRNIGTFTEQFLNDNGGEDKWIGHFYELNDVCYDLGITKIGIEKEQHEYGYEFLNGLSFNMSPDRPGWKRLKENIENMKELQKHDVDIFGVVTGGDNRVGKSTLALQILDLATDGEVDKEAIVVTSSGFWDAVNEQPEKGAAMLDELTDHFYSIDAMKGEQKKKKQKLKKYAKKNMFLIGTTPNFHKIDKEVRSDKVKFNVHVPSRGKFEFYTASDIENFERKDDGSAERLSPTFEGGFPKLTGDLWEKYRSIEDQKMAVEEEKAKGESMTVDQIVEEIKDRQEYFEKKYRGRVFLDKDLIAANFAVDKKDKIKQAKAKAEADLGFPKDTE